MLIGNTIGIKITSSRQRQWWRSPVLQELRLSLYTCTSLNIINVSFPILVSSQLSKYNLCIHLRSLQYYRFSLLAQTLMPIARWKVERTAERKLTNFEYLWVCLGYRLLYSWFECLLSPIVSSEAFFEQPQDHWRSFLLILASNPYQWAWPAL